MGDKKMLPVRSAPSDRLECHGVTGDVEPLYDRNLHVTKKSEDVFQVGLFLFVECSDFYDGACRGNPRLLVSEELVAAMDGHFLQRLFSTAKYKFCR